MSDLIKSDAVVPIGAPYTAPTSQELMAEQRRVVQAVQFLNKSQLSGEGRSSSFRFTIDREANRTVVKVVDGKTKEVLYQIPPDEAIRLAAEARRKVREGS